MAELADSDPRGAAWEARLRPVVVAAALAVVPLVALSLTKPHGAPHVVEVAGHWLVWATFAVEVAVMLAVVRERRAWIDAHRLELLVLVVSSPLVPLALALAPAVRLLVAAKAFKAIKLAKLGKGVRVVRRRLALRGPAEVALAAVAIALAAATVGYMVTDDEPLEGDARTVALVVAGMLATFGVLHLHARARR